MSKQPAKQPAKKDDTLKPGQYLEADNVIIRYMGPKVDGKYAVRVEDKFGRKKPTGIKRLSSEGMRSDAALPRAKELLKKQPDQPFKIGRFTVTSFIKKDRKKGGRKSRKKKRKKKRKTKRRTKRTRRKTRKTKRRVKKRKRTKRR